MRDGGGLGRQVEKRKRGERLKKHSAQSRRLLGSGFFRDTGEAMGVGGKVPRTHPGSGLSCGNCVKREES